MSGEVTLIIDVVPGIMATVLPAFDPPVFLRLGTPAGDVIDRARLDYLAAANAQLRTCTAGWNDGPGVRVERAPESMAALVAEVHELGRTLRALADPVVAQRHLDLMVIPVGADDGFASTEKKGE